MKKLIVILTLVTLLLINTVAPGLTAPETPDEPDTLGIAHGAHLRPAVYYGQEVAAFNSLVGKDLASVMYFMDWNTSSLAPGEYFDNWLPRTIIDTFGSNAPAVMLSWQPSSGSQPGCAHNYSDRIPLNDIIAGACDTYIRGFARELKALPLRFLIRFAHEMNLRESAWWPGHTGQDASAFIAAWRHVHDVFSQENVSNVEWVWAPNYESNPLDDWNDRNNYYPGDAYVDWVGVDGYNWGSPRWDTFSEIYDSATYDYVLKDFACRYPKPQLITEFASVEGPGSKSGWIADAYSKIPQFPFVRGVFWFNDFAYASSSQADFRVTSGTSANGGVFPLPEGSGAWTNAYRSAISNPIYTEKLASLEAATPPTTYCQTSGPQFTSTPAEATIKPGESSVHAITGIGYTIPQNLTLSTPSGSLISGSFSLATLPAPYGETILTLNTSPTTPPGSYPVVVRGNGVDLLTIQLKVFQQPHLHIDHQGVGSPGTTFTVTGEDFPFNQVAQLSVNAINYHMDTLRTNNLGTVSFSINTENVQPGYYLVTVISYPSQASIWFRLDENGELWQDVSPTIVLLSSTEPWKLAFLPSTMQMP